MIDVLFGCILGFLFGKLISGAKEGEPGLIHWGWFIKKTNLHLHHWMICSVLLFIYLMYVGPPKANCVRSKYADDLIVGFLFGCIAHGLTYKDRFDIIQS